MYDKTLSEQIQALEEKKISSLELTTMYLERIKQLDKHYNSFITVTEDIATKQAKIADEQRAKNKAQPLTGIPIAHKDIFCTQGVKTTCASYMLDNFIAPYESTVTNNFHQAGAIMLGKTNMDEFAMGSSSENSFYGAVKNPWDITATPGGSSGGSAACIAANFASGATGSDTGGSIRQPSSHCGITGLKPTYGRISRFGMIAYASSLDQAGPMAKSAKDCALMLNVMASFDPKDSTSIDQKIPDYTASLQNSLDGLTIGLPTEYFTTGLDPSIEKCINEAITEFKKMGASIKEVHLPHLDLSIPSYYVIASAEASTNLSRYDGVRFGHRCKNPKDLQDMYQRSRSEGFGEEVKRRILVGTYALSAGYYDAYYKKAQQIRRLIKDDFINAFSECDLIFAPNAPTTALDLGANHHDPVSMYLSDIYTLSVNLAGLPAMSIPVGFSNNRPIGLQIIAKHLEEPLMLNAAHRFQQVTDFHLANPNNHI